MSISERLRIGCFCCWFAAVNCSSAWTRFQSWSANACIFVWTGVNSIVVFVVGVDWITSLDHCAIIVSVSLFLHYNDSKVYSVLMSSGKRVSCSRNTYLFGKTSNTAGVSYSILYENGEKFKNERIPMTRRMTFCPIFAHLLLIFSRLFLVFYWLWIDRSWSMHVAQYRQRLSSKFEMNCAWVA